MKIDVATTLQKINANSVQLCDVRSPAEFNSNKIHGAINLPFDQLEQKADLLTQDQEIVLICESGQRAQKAYALLVSKEFSSLCILEGGMKAWKNAQAPCELGKGAISIERQVRIAAGALVALGTILGITIHTGFLAIPAFVGCGLVFAGVTDSCMMGLLIAKMPWNRA